MRHWRWYSKLMVAVMAALFAWYVWPTPYAYHTLFYTQPNGVSYSFLLRVNRFTGDMSYFTTSRMGIEVGWIGAGPGQAPTGDVIRTDAADWVRTGDDWMRVPKRGR